MKILIIEDDHTLSQNICLALQECHFATQVVYDGLLAERYLKKNIFDCLILDINLPGKNGFVLAKEFRQYNQHTPILMLTAFGELEDKIQGFECGADDYLTKPFYMRELILRVQSLIKRSYNKPVTHDNQLLIAGDIVLDKAQKRVFRNQIEITLTPREFQILQKLMEKKGEVISKAELIQEIWGSYFNANTNTIEVYVNFLRNKIDKPFAKNSIKTKVGFGYYLEV
ncbi:MAG: response regulator transcription factor [Bacteroidia bacterium]|nr:response regulator transcription factor [Bacteroidia bacterium]MDW8158912.1 response regulator transcription factor [Bacteroidia bacterium]